ncbi:MAG: class I SAM-dependent methyltransferase [Desulfuromonadales bacterium]
MFSLDTPVLELPVQTIQKIGSFDRLLVHEIKTITSSESTLEEQSMLSGLKHIESLMLEKEALALFRICKRLPDKAKILEIGSFQGGSTYSIGRAVENTEIELYCLDPWSNYQAQSDFSDFASCTISDDTRIMNNFIRNTSFIGDKLRMLKGKSEAFATLLAGMNFDMIFIDGAHDYKSVCNDIKIAFSALKPGGLICGHDYHNHGHGVVQAVTELIAAVPTIETGDDVIEETYIWFGIVPDPYFEFAMMDIADSCNDGYYQDALEKAQKAYSRYGKNEIMRFISVLTSIVSTG